jgi:hypothetical protein
VASIKGIAFVFHESNNFLRELIGVQHTYCVSSCFYSHYMSLEHHCSFSSFPCTSTSGIGILPSCFPSMMLGELLTVKNKVQVSMNTHSKNNRQKVQFSVDNINPFTWHWLIKDLPQYMVLSDSQGLIKRNFISNDELVIKKWRTMQQFFELTFPEHLEYAILLFGLCIGLGVRLFVPCPLKKAAPLVTVENSHQISVGDGVNIIPFEAESKELVWRGMQLHCTPSS